MRRDATRAKRIPRIADVAGTSLDQGEELDALARRINRALPRLAVRRDDAGCGCVRLAHRTLEVFVRYEGGALWGSRRQHLMLDSIDQPL